jgi:hypothetical protein
VSVVGVPATVQLYESRFAPPVRVMVVHGGVPQADARQLTKAGSHRGSNATLHGVGVHGAGEHADALPGLAVKA